MSSIIVRPAVLRPVVAQIMQVPQDTREAQEKRAAVWEDIAQRRYGYRKIRGLGVL